MLGDFVLLSRRNNIESKVVKLMTQFICEWLSCSNRNTNTATCPNGSTRYTDGVAVVVKDDASVPEDGYYLAAQQLERFRSVSGLMHLDVVARRISDTLRKRN
jgi:hypothetical protein